LLLVAIKIKRDTSLAYFSPLPPLCVIWCYWRGPPPPWVWRVTSIFWNVFKNCKKKSLKYQVTILKTPPPLYVICWHCREPPSPLRVTYYLHGPLFIVTKKKDVFVSEKQTNSFEFLFSESKSIYDFSSLVGLRYK
jgi:hypothetical protein